MTAEHRLLGSVETRVEGRLLDLGYAQQRCVLAVLLARANQVISVEELIGGVWGEDQPRSARTSLYAHIGRLRGILAAGTGTQLVRRAGGYLIEVNPETVDLYRFRRLIKDARAVGDGPAVCLFGQALGLWQGTPFAGLTSPWLTAMREALDAERIGAILDRNEACLRMGRHNELIGTLTELAITYPLDERLISQLMRTLYRSGRQADSLGQYHALRCRLANELGVDPQPELRRLYEQILRTDSGLTLAADNHRVRALHVIPAELPHDVRGFVGRDSDLAHLSALLAAGDTRAGAQTESASRAKSAGVPVGILAAPGQADADSRAAASQTMIIMAIDGAAGVGKTALAVRFAHQIAHIFNDGQLFINLRGSPPHASPMSSGEALGHLLLRLGAEPRLIPEDVDDRAALYRTLLSGRRLLVLLDDAVSAEQVRPILPGTATCLVVVTSRNRLDDLLARDGAHRISLVNPDPAMATTVLANDADHDLITGESGARLRASHPGLPSRRSSPMSSATPRSHGLTPNM